MSQQSGMGTLYGIGVGPGDPELVTLKALKAIKAAEVVFTARSSKNDYSIALNTVREHLREDVKVVNLDFPMTKDHEVMQAAWQKNAETVAAELKLGRTAVFLTIGDPLTYSTFGYLLKTLSAMDPALMVEIIPGITAYHAAAAKVKKPLVEGKESLLVVPGIKDMTEVAHMASCAENIVILKAYRNYDEIVQAIEALPDDYETHTISGVGLPEERVQANASSLKGHKMPYLSLIIAKRQP